MDWLPGTWRTVQSGRKSRRPLHRPDRRSIQHRREREEAVGRTKLLWSMTLVVPGPGSSSQIHKKFKVSRFEDVKSKNPNADWRPADQMKCNPIAISLRCVRSADLEFGVINHGASGSGEESKCWMDWLLSECGVSSTGWTWTHIYILYIKYLDGVGSQWQNKEDYFNFIYAYYNLQFTICIK